VHLSDWPGVDSELIDDSLEQEMSAARSLVEGAHAKRKEMKIKVRQPFSEAVVTSPVAISKEVLEVMRGEINVLTISFVQGEVAGVTYNTTLTPELLQMGKVRELIREIQMRRREKGCKIDERVSLVLSKEYQSLPKAMLSEVERETLVTNITWGDHTDIVTAGASTI